MEKYGLSEKDVVKLSSGYKGKMELAAVASRKGGIMDEKQVAGELLKLAREIAGEKRVGASVRVGDVCELDLRKAITEATDMGWAIAPWKSIVKRVHRNGDGYVKVERVRGDVADVFEGHLPVGFAGSVQVPVSALKVI